MHPAYFETHFTHEADWKQPGNPFAIITAYATTGETWSPQQNQQADALLKQELTNLNRWHARLTGYSPTTKHAEPGWAVELEFQTACDLGLKFRQDAIYYVENDQLYVSNCDARREMVLVGKFSERLHDQSIISSGTSSSFDDFRTN